MTCLVSRLNAVLPSYGRHIAGAWLGLTALLSLSPVTGVAQPSSPTSPYGTEVRVTINGERSRGELLAVSGDSLWVWIGNRTVALPRPALERVEFRRHNFTSRRALITGAAISGVTTLGIAAACSSPEADSGGGCVSVAAGWFAVTGLLSLFSGILATDAEWKTLAPDQWDQLAAHARHPQGLPQAGLSTPPPPF
jgi:hypothetical protein